MFGTTRKVGILPRNRVGLIQLSALLVVVVALGILKWYCCSSAGAEYLSTPADVTAFRLLEKRAVGTAATVAPAVVAVENGESAASTEKDYKRRFQPYYSGVIITPDGLVLSQFHVSHRRTYTGREPMRFLKAGHRTSVILSDGRRLAAELLGANQNFDLSLLRILEPGPYPYAPLVPAAKAKLGDWVLKLGQPLGYRSGRSPVVRLGRILFARDDFFVTDCFVTGGDSGGPFFDLDGNLLGMINSSHVPRGIRDSNFSSYSVPPMSALTSRFIRQNLAPMEACEIPGFDPPTAQRFDCYDAANDILPLPHWTQGNTTIAGVEGIARVARPSVVSILDENDREVLFGTIVSSAGDVATVASLLPATPRCRLSTGQVVAAEVVGMDPAFDLALLRVQTTGLQPVAWASDRAPKAGTILVAIGPTDRVAGVGIVSVPRRDLAGPFPTRVVPPKIHAEIPGFFGTVTNGVFVVDSVSRAAAAAGIKAGDVVQSVGSHEIHSEQDSVDCADGPLAGEPVTVRLIRAGQPQELILTFGAEPLTDSKPYADFPTMFEHDMPLLLGQCGGPVVDHDGRAIGITMYRGQYGCMAIPGDCVERVVADLGSTK